MSNVKGKIEDNIGTLVEDKASSKVGTDERQGQAQSESQHHNYKQKVKVAAGYVLDCQ